MAKCPPEPKQILITRLSAIGDCILTIPLAVEAKRLWPNCKITWVVECAARQLLERHSAVDELLCIDKGWLAHPSEYMALRQELRRREFDTVLDPQGLTKSSLLGWLSGARTRVGFDYSHGREVAPWVANVRVQRRARHMVDAYRELLRPWQEPRVGEGKFNMPIYVEARATAGAILELLGLNHQKWIAINPGAGWTTRLWPVQRFGMLAREIYRHHGRRSLVFWAGESELLLAKVVEEESEGAAVVAPRTSLTELLELVRQASLFVCGDTGPLHIASGVGAPTVSLHGPTWCDESGPYGNRNVAIQSPTPPLPNKLVRKGPNTAMQAIEFSEVYHACCQMFLQEKPSGCAAAA